MQVSVHVCQHCEHATIGDQSCQIIVLFIVLLYFEYSWERLICILNDIFHVIGEQEPYKRGAGKTQELRQNPSWTPRS